MGCRSRCVGRRRRYGRQMRNKPNKLQPPLFNWSGRSGLPNQLPRHPVLAAFCYSHRDRIKFNVCPSGVANGGRNLSAPSCRRSPPTRPSKLGENMHHWMSLIFSMQVGSVLLRRVLLRERRHVVHPAVLSTSDYQLERQLCLGLRTVILRLNVG